MLDLTIDGCKIGTPVAVLRGAALELEVERIGKLLAEVRWYSGGKAGLRFFPHAEEVREEKPREHSRVVVNTTASLRRSGGRSYESRVFDLSPTGCRVEFVERPATGEIVWIKFGGLDGIEAEVRWVEGFYAGMHFSRPIYSSVFDMLVAKLTEP